MLGRILLCGYCHMYGVYGVIFFISGVFVRSR